MRYLGLDLGTKTCGVAITDRMGIIANPLTTIKYTSISELIKEIEKLINEYNIGEIALGLPKNMDGSLGFASERSMNFKLEFEKVNNTKITLIDERLSTVEAENYMLSADLSRKKRKDKIDSVAASVILNTFIRMKGNENK